jgi:hypothetical protein
MDTAYVVALALIATMIARSRWLRIDNPGGFIGGLVASVISCLLGDYLLASVGHLQISPWMSRAVAVLVPWLWWIHELAKIEEPIILYLDCNGKPKVKPHLKWILAGGPVTWKVDVGPNNHDLIEIRFEEHTGKRGPFPQRNGDPQNFERGKYRQVGAGLIPSTLADPPKSLPWERWKYTVIWGNERLDPFIMVKK